VGSSDDRRYVQRTGRPAACCTHGTRTANRTQATFPTDPRRHARPRPRTVRVVQKVRLRTKMMGPTKAGSPNRARTLCSRSAKYSHVSAGLMNGMLQLPWPLAGGASSAPSGPPSGCEASEESIRRRVEAVARTLDTSWLSIVRTLPCTTDPVDVSLARSGSDDVNDAAPPAVALRSRGFAASGASLAAPAAAAAPLPVPPLSSSGFVNCACSGLAGVVTCVAVLSARAEVAAANSGTRKRPARSMLPGPAAAASAAGENVTRSVGGLDEPADTTGAASSERSDPVSAGRAPNSTGVPFSWTSPAGAVSTRVPAWGCS
jgi:hypothetical protein